VRSAADQPLRGYTLIQLLVSMMLAGLMLTAFVTVHGRARQSALQLESRAALEDSAMQALAYIGDDLRQAGYPGIAGSAERLAGIAGPADPVAIPVGGDCGTNFSVRLDRAVEGRNNRYDLACPANGRVVSGSDVLVLRRLAARTSPPETGRLQAALTLDAGALFSDGSPAGTPREIRDLVTSVYYVAAAPGEGSTPALRRKTLVKGPRLIDEEIAPGITDLQVQFGVDLDPPGTPANVDAYVHPDDARIGQPGSRVLAVRVWLLAESRGAAGAFDPAIRGFADRPPLPPARHRSRHLLVRTFHLPNGPAR
jgi:type IV pilus assembly protein PilW